MLDHALKLRDLLLLYCHLLLLRCHLLLLALHKYEHFFLLRLQTLLKGSRGQGMCLMITC